LAVAAETFMNNSGEVVKKSNSPGRARPADFEL